MRGRLTIIIIVASIVASASGLTFAAASASSGNENLFKSWRSLIAPILDLQSRVSELENRNAELEDRIGVLEAQVSDLLPTPTRNILRIDEFRYEAGDDVIIEGVINDVVDGETQVNFDVLDPNGSHLESEEIELDDDNNFGFVFSISNDAVDGIYTVRAEYADWTTYSYFIVDEVADPVLFEIDDDFYEPGDEVRIAGYVDDILENQNEVEITVIDPANNEIVNQFGAELGAGSLDFNEFDFVFDLDGDAEFGRYAVIVSYDNGVQLGFGLFDVGE